MLAQLISLKETSIAVEELMEKPPQAQWLVLY